MSVPTEARNHKTKVDLSKYTEYKKESTGKDSTMPSTDKVIRHIWWTPERVKECPWITEKDGLPWIGEPFNKPLVLDPKDQDALLTKIYKTVAANIGYLRFYNLVKQESFGITRPQATDWLNKQIYKSKFRPVFRIASAKAQVAKGPLQQWSFDFCTMPEYRGKGAIFVIVDRYSKYVVCYATKRGEDAASTVQLLDRWLAQLESIKPGCTKQIKRVTSDNGPAAISTEVEEWFERHHIVHVRTKPHNPTSNAQVERYNRSLRGYLHSTAVALGSPLYWAQCIPQALKSLNETNNAILKGKTPTQVAFDEEGIDHEAILERQKAIAQTRLVSKRYTGHAELQIGDYVRVSLRRIPRPEVGFQDQARFKSGQRKGSEQGYGDPIYIVMSRYGHDYKLMHMDGTPLRVPVPGPGNKTVEPKIDRNDLLRLESPEELNAYHREPIPKEPRAPREEPPPREPSARTRKPNPRYN